MLGVCVRARSERALSPRPDSAGQEGPISVV